MHAIVFVLTFAIVAAVSEPSWGAPPAHQHPVSVPPQGCAESSSQIAERAASLERALNSATPVFTTAADDAFALASLARGLGRVALIDATLPREKVKPINLAGKAIADAADKLHDALDENKPEAAKASLAALKPLVADLAAILPPDPYICDMRCEGKKSYDKPGICPICKMALIRQSRAPFAVQVSAASGKDAIVAGKPLTLDIRLLDQAADPVGALEIVHDHPLHFILVSEDLSYYTHEHPTRTPDGVFHIANITFPFGGRFVAFADFTPSPTSGTSSINRVARTEFTVPSGDTPPHARVALKENEDDIIKDGSYELRIRCNAGKFIAGRDSYIRYGVDVNNEPVKNLQPLMGAMGHLVIISADTRRYLHSHPVEGPLPPEIARFTNGKPSDVIFHTLFPEPGLYRAFAQFRHNGRTILHAVSIDAKVPEDGSPAAPPTSDHNHAHR